MTRTQRARRAQPAQQRGRQPVSIWARGEVRWLALFVLVVVVGIAGYLFFSASPSGAEARPLSAWKPADYHSLAFSVGEPDTLLFGHHNGLLKSADGGKSWLPAKEERNWDAMSLAVPKGSAGTIYVAGHDIFYKTTDGGTTWQQVRHTLPGTDIHAFATDPDNPEILYAFVVGSGLFKSDNAGTNWQALGRLPNNTMALTALPGTPKVLLAGTMQNGLLRSDDGGRTWAEAAGGFNGRAVMALAGSFVTQGLVYAGSEAGLFRSVDGGLSWQRLPVDRQLSIIAISPTDDKRLIGLDRAGRVHQSTDGGSNWILMG